MGLTNPFIEIGRREGVEQGQTTLVIRQLTRRLGRLSTSQKKRIQALDLKAIEALAESLLDFKSPASQPKPLRNPRPFR